MKIFFKISKIILIAVAFILIMLAANGFIFKSDDFFIFLALSQLVTVASCFIPFAAGFEYKKLTLRSCYGGSVLLIIFIAAAICTAAIQITFAISKWPYESIQEWTYIITCIILAVITLSVVFWAGIIFVYISSVQLGLRYRVLGAALGLVPIANIVMLIIIIRITLREVHTELKKDQVNLERENERICATKYPILLVHGVFFRDSKNLNYWGRIPAELERNGATIFYGNNESAQSVEISAETLADRIEEIVEKTGCEKVNVIAHSKGGLDSRYAIHMFGVGKYIASLTTINTPHRGCEFADYLLHKVSTKFKDNIANMYNKIFLRLGDKNPDFIEAVSNLTRSFCEPLDKQMPTPEGIFCQSVGSKLNHATGGKFPLNLSYNLVKKHDGDNDGLVGKESFPWGEKFTYITVKGNRGVSHGDMIDLNRENICEFDVREFYVQLVSDLKQRGY